MKKITINNLYKIYNPEKPNEFTALKNINMEIENGETVILKGVSGSGKSTLLSIIAALNKPTKGEVLVDGENISKLPDIFASSYRNKKIGIIFQSYNLINGLSVYDNVLAPLVLESRHNYDEMIKNALKLTNIEHKIEQKVSNLSGGEKQRCAIARAIVNNPDIVLADEATANLDKANSLIFIDIMRKFKELGKTVVIATHDIIFDELDFVDRYINIKEGELI